ncbi:deleted in malignant brain tumors 1 protein-like, partial [Clarias magur]
MHLRLCVFPVHALYVMDIVTIYKGSLALYIGVGVTAGLLLILVPVIVCLVKKRRSQNFQTEKKNTQ